jgi:NAD(P)H-dependent FMN reductase
MTAELAREPMRVLVISGSMRAGSLNTQLARLAAGVLERSGASVDFTTMREFDCPGFDADLEASGGMPAPAQALIDRLHSADAFVIAAPEYNASMPGVVKNAIDWASRARPQPFHAKHAMLLSASPSMVGGNRGAWALRVPLEHLGANVHPDMFSLAQAHKAYDDGGELADAQLAERLRTTLVAFLDLAEADKHYPCMRAAWVEFLTEPELQS